MADTDYDRIRDNIVADLGLSTEGFKKFAVDHLGYGELQLQTDRAMLDRLMQDDDAWHQYEEAQFKALTNK